MTRRTKIVATIGPASDSHEILTELVDAGVNVFRVGTAHDPVEKVIERIAAIRKAAAVRDTSVGVLVDLAGPKVRAGFGDEAVELIKDTVVTIRSGSEVSTSDDIFVNIDDVARGLVAGDELHMGDGNATLTVQEVNPDHATAIVSLGGVMRGRPGVHIPSTRLNTSSPTAEDLVYFDAVVDAGVDIVAVSFVKTAADVRRLGAEPPPNGPLIVAKIETQAAVDNLESILEHCGGIMVARGDLGLECGLATLPALQKRIITETVNAGRPVITATQMLESMTENSQPTRAEVTDVANAVFDGTSAVMLSGETAVGHNPVLVVKTMAKILKEAEKSFEHEGWTDRIERAGNTVEPVAQRDQVALAMRDAAQRAARTLSSRAIVTVTGTGSTARAISRYRPRSEIIAVAQSQRVVNQLCLTWGVTPTTGLSEGEGTRRILNVLAALRDQNLLSAGELVPIVAGSSNSALVSNVLRIENVPVSDAATTTQRI